MDTNYKYLNIISLLYITIALSGFVLPYKIVSITNDLIISGGILIFALTYIISDIVAEVYGYRAAKNLIWYMIFCDLIFMLLTSAVIHLPSPKFSGNQVEYIHIFGELPKFFLAISAGIIIGSIANIYCLSKWKVLLNGKFFLLRSIASTAIGELLVTVITDVIAYWGEFPSSKMIKIITGIYIVKMLYTITFTPLATIIVMILKKKEIIKVNNHLNFSQENINKNILSIET